MLQLNFPSYNFRLTNTKEGLKIFDRTRKKQVLLTPEEWVRQHLIEFLVNEKKIPRTLIGVEIGLKLNTLYKRADIIAYNRNKTPLLLVECKAPFVEISQSTFDQIATYNMVLNVPYLVVSNGLSHFCCKMDNKNKKYTFLKDIPNYSQLCL